MDAGTDEEEQETAEVEQTKRGLASVVLQSQSYGQSQEIGKVKSWDKSLFYLKRVF